MSDALHLSRRERQIMEVIYARRQATAAQVREALADPPSYSAVRALLRILEDKGHLKHHREKGKYVYTPTRQRESAARQALKGMLRTFFDNSAVSAVAALLDLSDTKLTPQQFDELSQLVEKAKKGNKP